MDQEKISTFIAACRKEAGYTQAALGEKLGVTDRAVSKWETGKSLPDPSLMLPLCELLNITVNELLTGDRIAMEDYRQKAEENLLALKEQEIQNSKKLLNLEWFIGTTTTLSCLILVFAACFATQILGWRIGLLAAALILLSAGIAVALKLEQEAGYYECPHCHARYVPTLKAVVLAPHRGRSRKMKCPYCQKKGVHKKVLEP